jgi:hypothetical protein
MLIITCTSRSMCKEEELDKEEEEELELFC